MGFSPPECQLLHAFCLRSPPRPPPRRDRLLLLGSAMIIVLYVAFVLSGAAGLIYESIWTRYLGLFVGHDAYAQIIVLVIFLGGMSLGAHLAGRWSHRLRSPLMWYATVELVVGVL